ncbi:MAG: GNAT family N-acetyltransferase [Oscillospiraceae bacterium]|jgi:predicted acetyltransferase|nr:GNAT family N-acetyltransferase [Oscillospiraceae bacterium]
MIDFAKKSDCDDIINVWKQSFDDTDEYIELFLNEMASDDNTIVFRDAGSVVAQYFFLDASIYIGTNIFKVLYIYAAATLPEYRSRGIMSKLIKKGFEIADQRSVDYVALSPASESLFDYYAKLGFVKAFNQKVLKLNRRQLDVMMKEASLNELTDMFKTRQKALSRYDFLSWDAKALNYAKKENEITNGKFLSTDTGYVLYKRDLESDLVNVKELCTTGNIGELFYVLMENEDAQTFSFNLPARYPLSKDDIEIVYTGMLKPISESAQMAMEKIDNAYLGITLG